VPLIINNELGMKHFVFSVIGILCLIIVFSSLIYSQDEPVKSGMKIFIKAKCNKCHSVKSQAIECSKMISFACDLSKVGDSLSTDFFKDYLMKRVKLNNKKHLVAFKGKSTELDILCIWLQKLRTMIF